MLITTQSHLFVSMISKYWIVLIYFVVSCVVSVKNCILFDNLTYLWIIINLTWHNVFIIQTLLWRQQNQTLYNLCKKIRFVWFNLFNVCISNQTLKRMGRQTILIFFVILCVTSCKYILFKTYSELSKNNCTSSTLPKIQIIVLLPT